MRVIQEIGDEHMEIQVLSEINDLLLTALARAFHGWTGTGTLPWNSKNWIGSGTQGVQHQFQRFSGFLRVDGALLILGDAHQYGCFAHGCSGLLSFEAGDGSEKSGLCE